MSQAGGEMREAFRDSSAGLNRALAKLERVTETIHDVLEQFGQTIEKAQPAEDQPREADA